MKISLLGWYTTEARDFMLQPSSYSHMYNFSAASAYNNRVNVFPFFWEKWPSCSPPHWLKTQNQNFSNSKYTSTGFGNCYFFFCLQHIRLQAKYIFVQFSDYICRHTHAPCLVLLGDLIAKQYTWKREANSARLRNTLKTFYGFSLEQCVIEATR